MWTRNLAWREEFEKSGLVHGTLCRPAVDMPGKPAFGEMIDHVAPYLVDPITGAPPVPEGGLFVVGGEQVHGEQIGTIDSDGELRGAPLKLSDAFGRWEAREFDATDALVTTLPGVLLAIKTADCLPILFWERDAQVAGAAHCGWRGLKAELAAKMVGAMAGAGADPERIEAWIGPGIRVQHYEVNAEMAREFRMAYGEEAVQGERMLDLFAVARAQLIGAGLRPEAVVDSQCCTYADAEKFHSYRRDGESSGRLLTFIGYLARGG